MDKKPHLNTTWKWDEKKMPKQTNPASLDILMTALSKKMWNSNRFSSVSRELGTKIKLASFKFYPLSPSLSWWEFMCT